MHKRFPGLHSPKKVWAAAPWAVYVIKVEGVYIAFDSEDDAVVYVDDNSHLASYTQSYRDIGRERARHGKAN